MKLEKLKLESKVLSKESMNIASGGKVMASVTGTGCSGTGSGESSDCCDDITNDC